MSISFALRPIVLILALVAAIALITLLWRSGKSGRWMAGIMVAALLFFGLFFAFPVTTRVAVQQHNTIAPIATQIVPQSPPALSPIWSEGIEQQFVADVYPSQAAAGRALGRQIVTLLPTLTPDKQMPSSIQIFGQTDPRKLTAETLHAIADGIRFDESVNQVLVEAVQIDRAESIHMNDPQAISIEVSLPKSGYATLDYQKANNATITSGTLSLTLMSQKNHLKRTAGFICKTWAENFAAFINQNQKTWRLARSQSSCTNENDAQQQALTDACSQAASVLHQWFQQQKMVLPNLNINPIDLEQAGIIADRFAQSFEGVAGRIWRQALLLDFSPEKLNQLAQKHLRITTATRHSWFRSILTLAGLLALICLIYFFLNMATRGYYTWSIRIAMLVLLAVGAGMILLIA